MMITSLKKFLEQVLLKYYGMTHSFSRRGYPYHNASLESWHGHLKREWVYQFKYKNFEEAYQSISGTSKPFIIQNESIKV